MPTINRAFKEISCKIVYYGPGLCGKTTNLQIIHKQIPGKHRGELVSLATEQDRTLFFDFLPLDLGEVKGFKTKFQLYTVPGQVFYNATRKLVLRGVDGLVFVADSHADRMEDNVESLENLTDNLREYGLDLQTVPLVLQYNKRDLPNAASVEALQRALNPENKYKWFESVAVTGQGVKETLKGVSSLVLGRLNETTVARGEQKVSKLAEAAAKRRQQQAEEALEIEAASGGRPQVVDHDAAPSIAAHGRDPGARTPTGGGSPYGAQGGRAAAPAEPAGRPLLKALQEGKAYWRGLPIGNTRLEMAQRKNVDGKGDFQLSGVVRGWLGKKYWLKMMYRADPGPDSIPKRPGLIYFRECDDSRDRHPPVEAWVEENEPRQLYVREIAGAREFTPQGHRLKEIL